LAPADDVSVIGAEVVGVAGLEVVISVGEVLVKGGVTAGRVVLPGPEGFPSMVIPNATANATRPLVAVTARRFLTAKS
jgi:hypothetical protein